jgi:hypothetical protein
MNLITANRPDFYGIIKQGHTLVPNTGSRPLSDRRLGKYMNPFVVHDPNNFKIYQIESAVPFRRYLSASTPLKCIKAFSNGVNNFIIFTNLSVVAHYNKR